MRIVITEDQVKELNGDNHFSEDEGKMIKMHTSNCKKEYYYSWDYGYIRDSDYKQYDEAGDMVDENKPDNSLILNDTILAVEDAILAGESRVYGCTFYKLGKGSMFDNDIILKYVIENSSDEIKELFIATYGEDHVDKFDKFMDDMIVDEDIIHMSYSGNDLVSFDYNIKIDGLKYYLNVELTGDEIVKIFS